MMGSPEFVPFCPELIVSLGSVFKNAKLIPNLKDSWAVLFIHTLYVICKENSLSGQDRTKPTFFCFIETRKSPLEITTVENFLREVGTVER